MLLVGDPNSEPVALIWPGCELTRQLAPRAIECCIRRLYAYDTLTIQEKRKIGRVRTCRRPLHLSSKWCLKLELVKNNTKTKKRNKRKAN